MGARWLSGLCTHINFPDNSLYNKLYSKIHISTISQITEKLGLKLCPSRAAFYLTHRFMMTMLS